MSSIDAAFRTLVREEVRAALAERVAFTQPDSQVVSGEEPFESTTELALQGLGTRQFLAGLCRAGRVPGAIRVGRSWRARRSDVLRALDAGAPGGQVVVLAERAAQILARRGRGQ